MYVLSRSYRRRLRAGWDFAADTKDEKGAARHMLKMTMDINANYFN